MADSERRRSHAAFLEAAEDAWPQGAWVAEAFLEAVALRGLPEIPPRLAAASGCAPAGPAGADGWASLGRWFGLALAEYPPDTEDWHALAPAGMLSYADGNLVLRRGSERRAATNPLVRDLAGALSQALRAGASWRWGERGARRHEAVIDMGRLRFLACFTEAAPGAWHQGWIGLGATSDLLNHLDREERLGRPVRTGLFAHLDAAIGALTREFLEAVGPESLRVDGLDAKRNAHNLRTYAGHAPDGYALEAIRDPNTLRGTSDGVTGVRFVRLPEPEPGPGGP